MSAPLSERIEMRVPTDVKERLRRAADARGVSLTQFAVEALSEAADEVLSPKRGQSHQLGWALGTAREAGDIVGPAVEPDEWDVLRG